MFPGTDMTISDPVAAAVRPVGQLCQVHRRRRCGSGGVLSLIKSLPLIVRTFRHAMRTRKSAGKAVSTLRTEQDIPMPVLIVAMVVIAVAIWLLPAFPVNLLGALIVVVFGFFFATVSSRMVGLIGSSNNPVSGMAIATLLISTMLLKATGTVGTEGMTGCHLHRRYHLCHRCYRR